MVDVCAKEIGKLVCTESGKCMPVIIGLSLAAYDGDTIREVLALVQSKRVW